LALNDFSSVSEDLAEQETVSEEEKEVGDEEEVVAVPLRLESPNELDEAVLLTVLYDGNAEKAVAILYHKKSGKLYSWYDNTNHHPYLLTDIPLDKIKDVPAVSSNPAIIRSEYVNKYHALEDKFVKFTRILARDPLAIGGRPQSLREKLPASWESRIRYANSFMYDRALTPGTVYRISNGNLISINPEVSKEASEVASLMTVNGGNAEVVIRWFNILSEPAPNFRRLAVDIEVESIQGKLPNVEEATERFIAVSFCGSDGLKKSFVLMKNDGEPGEVNGMPPDLDVEFFTDEAEMLRQCFKIISSYPIVLTFNGDNFDFKYLYHRAAKLSIPKSQSPITLGQREARLTTGIHLDLYQFFKNRAIQIYAFDAKYKEFGLDAIASALLGKAKVDLGGKFINDLSPLELANYCFRDSQITYELTTFSDNLVMKLIVMLMRISRTGMDDLVRIGVSSWIKNLMYSIHRERNYLIPNPEDISERKSSSSTQAVIKGKKYKGALVIEPKAGVYFGVTVLDFASLYPSILKEYNLSYETVRCPHKECESHKVPETDHWVCTKRRGVASELVGLLRDLRVLWFKPKSKDSRLSNEYRSWYDVAQRALKVYLNASYGVFGAETFPFYCLPVAESTAAIARYVITTTVKEAQRLNMSVLYGDTDSLFVLNPPKDKIEKLIAWAHKELKVDLDIDKEFRYVAFSERKKNYFGVKFDGSVDIKGLLGKKRNTPPLIKDTFQKALTVLSGVESSEDFQKAKERVRSILRETYSIIRYKRFDVDDLAISVMLSKNPDNYKKTTPQHIKAARLLREKTGRDIGVGDIIRYVKTYDGVLPVELAKPQDVDTAKYVDLLRTTFDQILDALDLDFDEAMGERKLESFFLSK
jgi:DNA polymerase I